MSLHPQLQAITERVIRRSAASRAAYLAAIDASLREGPFRSRLSCGNLAHGFAACGGTDKSRLRGGVTPNLGIITAYNDMLSAHQPFETYPEQIREIARELGATAQVAGGVPAMCDGVTQGRGGMELSLFSRDVIAQATAVGLSHEAYHVIALAGGIPAGIAAVVGLVILVYRRRTVGPVFSATTPMDKVMYFFLGLVILLGMWNTIAGGLLTIGGEDNYRDGVSPWFRQIFWFQPDASLMEGAPLGFQLHALAAMALFAMWPFTRLVHVFSAPLWYLWRPYVVYRRRTDRLGARATRPGWERSGAGRR